MSTASGAIASNSIGHFIAYSRVEQTLDPAPVEANTDAFLAVFTAQGEGAGPARTVTTEASSGYTRTTRPVPGLVDD
ncbi:MAG: hypothetical protein KC583_23655, partial [Myxococcales bacterium]|nr:hypothetical protein [Myxococcales bacterium]